MKPKYYSVQMLAQRWGVSRQRVMVWLEEGRLGKAYKINEIEGIQVAEMWVVENRPGGIKRPKPRVRGKDIQKS